MLITYQYRLSNCGSRNIQSPNHVTYHTTIFRYVA